MVEGEAEAKGLGSEDVPAEPSIEFSLAIPSVGTILSWLTSDREEASGGIVAALGRVGIFPVLAAGLVLRLFLATLPGFGVDVVTFEAWANQLAATGPWDFYDTDFFTDYAPGYLYILWFIGELNERLQFSADTYQYILKLPSIAADLASAYLLYRILEGKAQGVRVGTAALYLALPFVWFTGAVWGQVDSLLAVFVLLSVFLLARGRPIPAAAAYTVAFLVKPQAIAALPFLGFWGLRHYPPKIWAGATAVALVLGLVIIVPFFGDRPWDLFGQLQFAASYYQYASFHAYNFWAAWPVSAYLKTDNIKYLGLSYQVWGFVLYTVSISLLLYSLRRSRGLPALALGTSLSMLLFYMFVTRMHERYIFAFFLPFLVACVLYNNRLLWTSFAGLTFIHSLNLYHAYAEFNDNELRSQRVFNWLRDPNFWNLGLSTVEILSLFMFLLLLLIASVTHIIANRPRSSEVT